MFLLTRVNFLATSSHFSFFFMMLEGLEYLSEEPGTVLLSERGVVAGNLEARCRDHGGGVNNVIRN